MGSLSRPDADPRRASALIRDAGGSVVGASVIARDVTVQTAALRALAESEARYRTLVELSPDAILILQGRTIVYANAAAAVMAGTRTPEELVGRGALDLIQTDEPSETAEAIDRILDEQPIGGPAELEISRLDGGRAKVEVRWAPISHEGRPALQVVVRDVSERKEAEEALRSAYEREHEAAEQLRGADQLKDEFLSIISHELRTPLTAIAGFSSVLERQSGRLDDATISDIVARIGRNADQMRQMVEQILDFSRLQAGNVELHRRRFELRNAVERCAGDLGVLLDGRPVEIDVPSGLEIDVDPHAFERVLGNLLSNAAKFSPPGESIEVSARAEAGSVVVTVADRGPGIEESDRPRIFERFYQGLSQPAGIRGAGVGLAVVRRYVELHGGKVWVQSIPGEGAAFSFSLAGPRVGR